MTSRNNTIFWSLAVYVLGSVVAAPLGYIYGKHVQSAVDQSNCTDAVSFAEEKDKWNCDKAVDTTIQACGEVCHDECLLKIREVCGPNFHRPEDSTGL